MVSRLITRTVLVSIISALVWALWWTWTAEFENIAQRVALIVLESSVLLVAALSLLFESFRLFGAVSVKRRSWGYFLTGLYVFDENRKTPSITARTCELFGVRSVIMTMFSGLTALCLALIYQAGKATVLFLLNPYTPVVNWSEGLSYAGLFTVGVPFALLAVAGAEFIEKKFPNRVAKTLVLTFYGSAAFGLVMGTISVFEPSGFKGMPAYLVMLMGTGVALALASLIGTVLGLAYAIYKFVDNMSQRFPVLGNVWNQICPVQTVNFLD